MMFSTHLRLFPQQQILSSSHRLGGEAHIYQPSSIYFAGRVRSTRHESCSAGFSQLGVHRSLHVCQSSADTLQTSDPNTSGEPLVDSLDVETLDLENPFGRVEDVMTEHPLSLKTAYVTDTLDEVVDKFDKVSGLPVVDENGIVQGVITKKDILKAKKDQKELETETVGAHMTSPAVSIRKRAHTGEAAGLMLAHKIHRLPVVDKDNKLLGIVSRTDIFRPLLSDKAALYDIPQNLGEESEAPLSAKLAEIQNAKVEEAWQIKYLYDGECPICMTLKATLERLDKGEGKIKFVNIADFNYDPEENEGIEFEDAMDTIHAIRRDGTIIKSTAALNAFYSTVGLGWASQLAQLPLVSQIADCAYTIISKTRLPMGKAMGKALDAMSAMHRVTLSVEGKDQCGHSKEECEAPEW